MLAMPHIYIVSTLFSVQTRWTNKWITLGVMLYKYNEYAPNHQGPFTVKGIMERLKVSSDMSRFHILTPNHYQH